MSVQRTIIIVFLYLAIGLALVFYMSDTPMFSRSEKKGAAIAIRDNVSKFEKNGSLIFSRVCFDRKYVKSIYFTQNFQDEHKQAFTDSLSALLKNYEEVDVYVLAHTNEYFIWLANVDPELRKKINFAYNTGCGNFDQYNIYKDLGADAYIGHKGRESLSPIFYFYFLRRYCSGIETGEATEQANEKVLKVLKVMDRANEITEHEGLLY